MAISANSVFEVRTAGNDTNGGGFVTGTSGSDFSQQDAKNTAGNNISTTDAVAVGTGVITSATASFTSAIVGNIIYLQGGTGSLAAGWYQVTVFTSSTSITVDRNVAAGTGITMNIGGALASPGMAGGVGLVTGNIIYIKSGTYTITSATANISGGCFSSSLGILHIQGYQTTRGDLGTKPLLQASGISTFTVIDVIGADSSVANLNIDCASLTASRAFRQRGLVFKCHAANCTNNAFVESTQAIFIQCSATGSTSGTAFPSGSFIDCIAYDNDVTGFAIGVPNFALRCIADTNNGFGFTLSADSAAINCIAYANINDGFSINDDQVAVINCIAENNSASGIDLNSNDSIVLINNATYNNTSGGITSATGKGVININPVAGSASFFTNAAGQDFTLNNNAGGGASARAAGYPGALPVGGTGYLDIGALQHQEAAGIPFFSNVGAKRFN